MMDIVLFQEITTDEALTKLEAEGDKFTGLYCDMNDKEQRKYVKDNAVLIKDLIKKVDRSRILQKKVHATIVENEAKAITDRLEAANLPFTMLIDAYKHERAEILAKQKAKDDAMALGLQIEADHEHAILMDKVQTLEAAERAEVKTDMDQRIADLASAKALQLERERAANEAKGVELARLQREADKEHVSSVLNAAKVSLMEIALDEATAKIVVKAIRAGLIANVTISY